ncbi:GNAT family N-acetyltransferase [Rhodococcus sp. IEGM 1354]|uniref:GNAT family N-acetyltransferase n=1 Tax=Rhodococcus sp. IEGM 1354 TaxID=3047088 RepID=UPI0024B87736|nr:GNAT family N-acetyltransferase [Rhodococcus sp. IEGM 1354]MDI9931754.1 GNAT family N-acetyltransferase [Rhodococcus sp. IEGM 1354]
MSSYSIRDVRPGDEHRIGTAHVAIWKATYAGMMNDAKLDAMRPEHRIERWEQIIAHRDESSARGVRTRCAIDVADSGVVGFATGGPPRDENPPAPRELWSLNVLPEHHGTGIALALMNDVLGEDTPAAYLWVAAANERAVAFYRKNGFELDGEVRFDPTWECHEARMVRV